MIELNRLYEIMAGEFNYEWANFFQDGFSQHPLPTEVVVSQAQFIIPKMARVYKTHMFCYCGKVYCYSDLHEKVVLEEGDFKGTDNHGIKEIFMFEQWESSGEDGHTETYLMGYRFAALPEDKRIPLIRLIHDSHDYFEALGKYSVLHPGIAIRFTED
jgi:hypothetical protein